MQRRKMLCKSSIRRKDFINDTIEYSILCFFLTLILQIMQILIKNLHNLYHLREK